MRLAAVQFRAHKGDVAGSRAALVALTRTAAIDADLVVLPEMCTTGYVFADREAVRRVAEAPDGPLAAALAPIAKTHGCWLVAGFPELDGDRLFNSALVIDPDGRIAWVYRKTLLFDADVPWAEPGDRGYRAFDTAFGRFGVGICMDLNDDRFVDWVRTARLDALAFPTNWLHEPELGIPVWDYWAWRLQGLPTALVAADTWGTEAPLTFAGSSAILQNGRIYAGLGETGDGVARASLPRGSLA